MEAIEGNRGMPRLEQFEPTTEELPLPERRVRAAERRLSALAAAVREHERETAVRPYSVRYADLHLYRRLRQISGG
jgi:hypothetical protein